MTKNPLNRLLIISTLLISSHPVYAYDINLEWDQNPSAEQLTGYIVCYREYNAAEPFIEEMIPLDSGQFIFNPEQPNRIQYVASDLTDGKFYELSIKAYLDDNGMIYQSEYAGYVNNYNNSPIINQITANPNEIQDDQSATITVSASDPEGDPLVYGWSVNPEANIAGNGSNVVFTPPTVLGTTPFQVTVEVSDNQGNSVYDSIIVTVSPSGSPPSQDSQTPWQTMSDLYSNHNQGIYYYFTNTGYEFTPLKDGVIEKVGGNFYGTTEIVLWENPTIVNNIRKADFISSITLDSSDNSDYAWRYISLPQPMQVTANMRYAITMHAPIDVMMKRTQGVVFEKQSGNIIIHYPLIGSINITPTDYPEYNTSDMIGQVDVLYTPLDAINHPPFINAFYADPDVIDANQTSTITVDASDPDNDYLTYTFFTTPDCYAPQCNLIENGASATFSHAAIDNTTQFTIEVDVDDQRGGQATSSTTVTVIPTPTPTPNPTPTPTPNPTPTPTPNPTPTPTPSEGQTPWQTLATQYSDHSDGHLFSFANIGYEFTPLKDGWITGVGGNFAGATEIVLWENASYIDMIRAADVITSVFLDASDNSDYSWKFIPLPQPVRLKANQRYAITMYAAIDVLLMETANIVFDRQSGDIVIHHPIIGEIDNTPTDYPEYNTSLMTGQVDISFVPDE